MTEESFNIAAATPQELGLKVLEEVSSPSPNLYALGRYLAAKPDLEQKNADGLTPLLASTIANHTEASQMLIAAGASACATDNNGDTPLMHAVQHKNLKVVKDLVTVNAPRRRMDSSMSCEMWDRLMESYTDQIAAADKAETSFGVFRPLALLKAKS